MPDCADPESLRIEINRWRETEAYYRDLARLDPIRTVVTVGYENAADECRREAETLIDRLPEEWKSLFRGERKASPMEWGN